MPPYRVNFSVSSTQRFKVGDQVRVPGLDVPCKVTGITDSVLEGIQMVTYENPYLQRPQIMSSEKLSYYQ